MANYPSSCYYVIQQLVYFICTLWFTFSLIGLTMKKIKHLIPLFALCFMTNACDDNSESNPYADMSEFEIACTVTGGMHENGKCKCDNVYCDDGEVCNAVTKKCPLKSLPEVCAKDSVTCTSGMMYRCNANSKFVEDLACPTNVCLPDHSGCAECVNDSCESGYLKKCIGGTYQSPVLCESSECASPTACTKECDENDRICRDGSIQLCVNEHYQVEKKCEFGCDKNTKNSCASSCSEGATLCTDGKLKTCSGGNFGAPQACENHNSCSSETECGVCVNNEVYCVDDETSKVGYLRTCRSGQLNDGFKCNDDHSCNPGQNKCGSCKNGERRCVNDEVTLIGKVQICENGEFVDEKTCDGDFSCKSASACGDCLNNTQTCENDDNGIGTERTCLNGSIVNKPCPEANSCNKNKCGDCRNGFAKCGDTATSINMLLECKNGVLNSTDCSAINKSTPWCPPGKSTCQATRD